MAKNVYKEAHRQNEIHIGGLKKRAREVQRMGVRGLAHGKFIMTTHLSRSLENALFLENLPLTEAKNHV